MEIGDPVWLTDGKKYHNLALVTEIYGGNSDPLTMPWINAAYVTPDSNLRDHYGRPITRIMSVPFLGTATERKVWWTSCIYERLYEA